MDVLAFAEFANESNIHVLTFADLRRLQTCVFGLSTACGSAKHACLTLPQLGDG
jgi:hypothetical protein